MTSIPRITLPTPGGLEPRDFDHLPYPYAELATGWVEAANALTPTTLPDEARDAYARYLGYRLLLEHPQPNRTFALGRYRSEGGQVRDWGLLALEQLQLFQSLAGLPFTDLSGRPIPASGRASIEVHY